MNEAIKQMLKRYNVTTLEQEEHALQEIIQEITLLGLWRGKFFEHAAFCGGTALRILYQLDRFSEDLDFTLLEPRSDFDLASYFGAIDRELSAFGFEVTLSKQKKSIDTPIESDFLKADTAVHLLLIESRNKVQRGKKIRVKFELDTQPCGPMATDGLPVLLPIQFFVKTLTLPYLFAEKMHAVLFRKWNNRVKGRDWYDFAWYVARDTPMSLLHLHNKIIQSEGLSPDAPCDEAVFRSALAERIEAVDLDAAKADALPFVPVGSIDAWSKDLFRYLADRIKLSMDTPG